MRGILNERGEILRKTAEGGIAMRDDVVTVAIVRACAGRFGSGRRGVIVRASASLNDDPSSMLLTRAPL